MPWKSVAQARWGHSPAGRRALGAAGVREWDEATPEGSLAGTKGSAQHKKAEPGTKAASEKHQRKLKRGEFKRGGYNWRDYE